MAGLGHSESPFTTSLVLLIFRFRGQLCRAPPKTPHLPAFKTGSPSGQVRKHGLKEKIEVLQPHVAPFLSISAWLFADFTVDILINKYVW